MSETPAAIIPRDIAKVRFPILTNLKLSKASNSNKNANTGKTPIIISNKYSNLSYISFNEIIKLFCGPNPSSKVTP